jgi:DNA replication protein DnaC
MARAFADQSALNLDHLGFEERLGLLVEHEVSERDGKALAMRLQRAKLKPNTAAEDTDYHHARGLDTALYQRLLAGLWLQEKQNVLLTGATGVGKTWLACALAHQACRMGRSAYYLRLPRLLDELAIGRADGRYMKMLKQLGKTDVLVIDDWGLVVLDDAHRRDLLERSVHFQEWPRPGVIETLLIARRSRSTYARIDRFLVKRTVFIFRGRY